MRAFLLVTALFLIALPRQVAAVSADRLVVNNDAEFEKKGTVSQVATHIIAPQGTNVVIVSTNMVATNVTVLDDVVLDGVSRSSWPVSFDISTTSLFYYVTTGDLAGLLVSNSAGTVGPGLLDAGAVGISNLTPSVVATFVSAVGETMSGPLVLPLNGLSMPGFTASSGCVFVADATLPAALSCGDDAMFCDFTVAETASCTVSNNVPGGVPSPSSADHPVNFDYVKDELYALMSDVPCAGDVPMGSYTNRP